MIELVNLKMERSDAHAYARIARKAVAAGMVWLSVIFVNSSATELAARPRDRRVLLAAEVPWIEESIRLPKGASELARYDRYYAWSSSGRDEIYLLMVLNRRSGIHLVDFDDLPFPRDGACEVIHARVLIKSHKVVDVKCNPGA